MISEDDVEAALTFLHENAKVAAKARAERVYVEEYRKSLKAIIMGEHKKDPLGAQEREAYADKRYIAHLDAIKDAVFEDEHRRFLARAADATLDAHKTQSWNERAAKL